VPVVLRAALAGTSLALAQTLATYAHAEGPSKRECVEASETGQELRKAGHLRDARTKFRTCLSPSCPRPVREDCDQHLADVQTSMPTVVLAVRDRAGKDLFPIPVAVRVDGQSSTQPLSSTPIEVDPGEHQFKFEIEGQRSVDKTVVVHEGDKDRLVLVVIGSAPTPEPVAQSAPSPPAPAPDDSSRQWIGGIALGAAGVVAAGAGLVLSLVARSTYDHALSAECGGYTATCTAQGAADGRTAYAEATGSTASFIGAGALVAAGAVVFFTSPRGASVAPTVGYRGGGLSLDVPW
jgi:hypothetical protein